MLLARLQGEAIGRLPRHVDGLADEAAGHQPRQAIGNGAVGGMRAAEPHRYAEALHWPDSDVGAERSRRFRQGQRQRVGNEDHQRVDLLGFADGSGMIAVNPECIGPRHDQRRRFTVRFILADRDAQRSRVRFHHIQNLRMQRAGQRNFRPFLAVVAEGHADGLGHRRRLVEQGGGGDRQAGQFGHKGLEMEQHFEPPLADLGLIGGIGRVPGGVLEQIALDDRRHDAAMVALADKAFQHLVFAHHFRKFGQSFRLACRSRQVERAVEPD